MRVRRRGAAVAVLGAALGIALTGCGVQPTGVIDAGEPATGLTRGVRLYYASAGGLRGVPLLDQEIRDLNGALKMLAQPPSDADRRDGLTSLVQLGGYSATGSGTRVTIRIEGPYSATGRDLGTGQLVCTLARAQSVLEPKVRTDDVEVTLDPTEGDTLGPYRCAEFLNG
ncbi:GerMN domain-containing protein [Streptomyces sp. NPDC054863]